MDMNDAVDSDPTSGDTCNFATTLTAAGTRFRVVPAVAAAAAEPATATKDAKGCTVIVLGSEDHVQVLVERIREISALLTRADRVLTHAAFESTTGEVAQRVNELRFLRTHPDQFPNAATELSPHLATLLAKRQCVPAEPRRDSLEAGPSPAELATDAPKGEEEPGFDMDAYVSTNDAADSSSLTSSQKEMIHVTASTFGELQRYQEIELDDEHEQLLRRPLVRQYFVDGVLHRAAKKMHVPWQELFQDLIYVAAIAKAGYVLHHDMSWAGLARFTLVYIPIFFHWTMMTLYNNRFVHNDLFHKFYTIVQMLCVTYMASNCANAFDPAPAVNTSAGYLLAVVASMAANMLAHAWVAAANDTVRHHVLVLAGIRVPELSLFLAAALVPAGSTSQFALWSAAIGTASVLHLSNGALMRRIRGPVLAVNIEHLAERYGLYVIVVLGEIAVAIIFESTASSGATPWLAAAFGLLTGYALQFIYFRVEAASHRMHAIRRSVQTGLAWSLGHIPLGWAIVALGAGIANLVAQTVVAPPMSILNAGTAPMALKDAGNTLIQLASGGGGASTDPSLVAPFLHWVYWSLLSLTFAIMGCLGLLHLDDKSVTHTIPRRTLILSRFAFAALFLVLGGLGTDSVGHFTPLESLGLGAAVSVLAMIVEEVGGLCSKRKTPPSGLFARTQRRPSMSGQAMLKENV
ncbi:hypothetical protein H9P43_008954 [Blastocladiella emersonii ATCC 22665]|nr:hypothetical protein H9P43_008954 [Blastocladiella emersonii ATCC 22665]